MPWQSLFVAVDADTAERLSDSLMEAGALSVAVEDAHAGTAAEQPIFGEPGSTVDAAWTSSRLQALVEAGADPGAILARACDRIGMRVAPPWWIEVVPDDDWVQRTQAQFGPIRISARLWIVPSWHVAVDPQAINIVLDPGLAFGTGSHPTTQLCLRWLEHTVRAGDAVIDYGCGSGILAIAAAKFGATTVHGVDIDPDAVVTARANAARNNAGAEFATIDQPLATAADIVVANILANPLRLLAPALARLVRPGGRLAIAGVLDEQAGEVAAAYAPYFDTSVFAASDGWTCLQGVRGDAHPDGDVGMP